MHKNSWFFDILYCNHIIPNKLFFSHKTSLAHPTTIYTFDGSSMLVGNIRSISSSKLSIGKYFTLFLAKLSFNLLSISQFCKLSLDLHFSNCSLDVQDPHTNQLFGIGHKVEHLFEVNHLKVPSHMIFSSAIATITPNLWHFPPFSSCILVVSSIISILKSLSVN